MSDRVLDVKNLYIDIPVAGGMLHAVDGISGATITSKGVTSFLKRDLNRYKLFFKKYRNN